MITTSVVRRPVALSPPVLLGSVPRDVRLTGGGIAVATAALLLAVAAIVSAIVLSVVYLQSEAAHQLRQRDGVTADAAVVQVEVRRGEHPRRIATYRYEVNGHSYVDRATLRRDQTYVSAGGRLRIGYVPSRPATSWLIGGESSTFPWWTIPLAAVSLLLAAAAVAATVRRQWVLLAEGRAAQARVTGVTKIRSDKRTRYRVNYEFRTISGATGRARCDVERTPPPIGALIPIVYHRDAPQWSAIYPLRLVRPGRSWG